MVASDTSPTRLAHHAWPVGQAVLVAVLVFSYFRIRGVTEGAPATAVSNAKDIVALERWLGIYLEPRLHEPIASRDPLAAVANSVYIYGHWPVIVAVMLWLAWHHRAVFRQLRDAMMISGAVGMVVFATYPVAPPRLVDDLGLVDTVTESSSAYRVLQPPAFVNQYAAMPSLHLGWDLLVGMAIFAAASSVAWKAVGVAMPVVMGLAVVGTANHYVLDAVAGVALVLIAHVLALRLERRRDARNTGPPGDRASSG